MSAMVRRVGEDDTLTETETARSSEASTEVEQERVRMREAASHWEQRRASLAEEARKVRAYRGALRTPADKMLFNDCLQSLHVMMTMCRKLAKAARARLAAI